MRRSFYHLTQSDREVILEGIVAGMKLKDIAETLGKDPTSVSREVSKYRSYEGSGKPSNSYNLCTHFAQCTYKNLCSQRCEKDRCATCITHVCARYCGDYEQRVCKRVARWPYVCNGCVPAISRRCRLVKYRYYPSIATAKADKGRSESRKGISLDSGQMATLNEMLTPLIRNNKMSVEAACQACAGSVNVSAQTIRRYIDAGKTTTIRLDLLNASSRRTRKKATAKTSLHKEDGRSYSDFESLDTDVKANAWEMDTVVGSKRDRARLMTLCHRSSNFLLMFRIEDPASRSVVDILDYLEGVCASADFGFADIFGTILTDNGAEFSDSDGIERSTITDQSRCSLYYCDPYSSWQKPHVEASHTFIRRVLPKGQSFQALTHTQVQWLCSHINSYPRPSKGCSPIESWARCFIDTVLAELGIVMIEPKHVRLTPKLLDR